jgi:hypothetical protein
VNGTAADALTVSRHAVPTAVLLDPTGSVARLYAAKTTPHMFVIDKDGTLKYMGGIDSLATTDEADIARPALLERGDAGGGRGQSRTAPRHQALWLLDQILNAYSPLRDYPPRHCR